MDFVSNERYRYSKESPIVSPTKASQGSLRVEFLSIVFWNMNPEEGISLQFVFLHFATWNIEKEEEKEKFVKKETIK